MHTCALRDHKCFASENATIDRETAVKRLLPDRAKKNVRRRLCLPVSYAHSLRSGSNLQDPDLKIIGRSSLLPLQPPSPIGDHVRSKSEVLKWKKKIRSIPSPLSLSPSPLLARTVQRVTHAEDSVFESWQSGQRVSLRASTISGYFADFPRNLHCMQAPYEVEEKNSTTARLPALRGKNKTFSTPIGGDVSRPKSDSPEPRFPHSERGSHARLAADVQVVHGEREREPPPPHSLLLPTGRERKR